MPCADRGHRIDEHVEPHPRLEVAQAQQHERVRRQPDRLACVLAIDEVKARTIHAARHDADAIGRQTVEHL
jgi:hypothetical protein